MTDQEAVDIIRRASGMDVTSSSSRDELMNAWLQGRRNTADTQDHFDELAHAWVVIAGYHLGLVP